MFLKPCFSTSLRIGGKFIQMIRLVLIIILFPINYTLANDYISRDPNYLSRGSFGKAYGIIGKLKNKNAYQIIKDPTGFSPIEEVEMFSPKSRC